MTSTSTITTNLDAARVLFDAINTRALTARLEQLDTPLRSPSLDSQGGASTAIARTKGDTPTHSDATWQAAAERNPAWLGRPGRPRATSEVAAVARAADTIARELAKVHAIYAALMSPAARTGPCTVCSRQPPRPANADPTWTPLNAVLLCDRCTNALRMAWKRADDAQVAEAVRRLSGDHTGPSPARFDPEAWRMAARRKHDARSAADVRYRTDRHLRTVGR